MTLRLVPGEPTETGSEAPPPALSDFAAIVQLRGALAVCALALRELENAFPAGSSDHALAAGALAAATRVLADTASRVSHDAPEPSGSEG